MRQLLCWLTGMLVIVSGCFSAARAEDLRYGAWLPYWEYDAAMEEMQTLAGRLDEVVAFAAVFDSSDHPLMLPDSSALLDGLRQTCAGTTSSVYLSVVNDVQTGQDTYDNKSADLLRRLFADESAQSQHLEDLTSLMDTYALTGLELDYENLKSDKTLWKHYADFIKRIWTLCARDGVRLRVVLPWDAPAYVTLPTGPEYSVMCYNLYGYHSGPGPKADIAFLKKTCAYYQPLCATVRMAFATGGFDWHGDQITALTQQQAEEQLSVAGAEASRDPGSGALTATYIAEGETHTLWYADAQTLATWRDVCRESGFTSFDLFRLGGNNLTDWDNAFLGAQP